MKKIVLLRHGESVWNKENRFTGWTDVDLSETGRQEAAQAGKTLKEAGYDFDICYTSYLKDYHLAEDATQGTFMKAMKKLKDYFELHIK